MSFAERFLPEFDQEMATTRGLLACVPVDKAAWKPHAKSRSLGELAQHITGVARFGQPIVTQTELRGPGPVPPALAGADDLLARFDANVTSSRDAIAGLSDDELGTPWTLRVGDHVIFTMPRKAVLRTLLMSHMIHHRGQLSVYLRLLDVPLPSIYGPTADT